MGSQQLRSLVLLLAFVLCCSLGAEGCLEKERTVLLQLRDSLYYPTAPNVSEWPWSSWVGRNCCTWTGVSCQEGSPQRVVSISLSSKRKAGLGGWAVNGSLFASLEELQKLDLGENQISGWLETRGMLGLKKLQNVDLRENLLTDEGVSWLFGLPSLVEVDLSSNKLRSSSILKAFCGQKSLKTLNLQQNMIEGAIDPCVSDMRTVEELNLYGNRFVGKIPSLTNMRSLRSIALGQNRLSGVFYFSSLANLSNLTAVVLSDNHGLEVETEHPSWVPSFQLDGLALDGCALNRRSGSRIPSFLSTQKNMFLVSLSRTSIQGTIPAWLFDNVGGEGALALAGNSLSGPLPQLDSNRTRGVQLVDLSRNRLSGPMPQNMSSLLPELYHLNLSRNAFHGSMASFGQLRYLGVLDLSHNGLAGEIPAELTANGSRLSHLRLSHNHLEGSILPKGSNMKFLRYLFLEHNRFTGSISSDLKNSPSLIILNLRRNHLSGEIPRELFGLPTLAAVLLSGNRFHGPIPSQFCGMQGLRMLDLAENAFSGAIPSCLSNVTSWRENSTADLAVGTYFGAETVSVVFRTKGQLHTFVDDELSLFTGIDLSVNQLTGAIPAEVGAMAALRSLNLSRNHISGEIPSSLQGLALIESLDLSHNQLSGSIPPQIARLPHLSVFCVAYNKLMGSIPFGSKGCF